MLETLQWIVCGSVGGLAALCLFANWCGIATAKKPISLIFPFFCGPVCAATCWFSPSTFLQRWFWIPLVLDFTLWLLVAFGVSAIARWIKKSPQRMP